MAEVKLSVTGKNVLTYTDNAALITASIAPPSMTYVDQNPQVTMAKDPVIVMTYTEVADVELEAPIKRDVLMDVELNGRIERTVDSDDPFKVSIQGDIIRNISNSVVLEYQLQRTVLSYNVGLTYGLRRVVTNSVELEGNLTRDIRAKIELQGKLARVVVSDEDDQTGVPTKEYGSFVEKNKLYRVQHDVLDEDVSDNPYFDKQISNLKNAALLTKNQTIIKAINELFINQKTLFETTFNAFEKFDSKIGDIVEDKDLNTQYRALGYRNIIDAIIKLADNIDGIISFIGAQKSKLEELGYTDLIQGLSDLNNRIKALVYDYDDWNKEEVEWIFKLKEYIPDIKDTVFEVLDSMGDEIQIFEQKVENKFIEFKRNTDDVISNYYLAFVEKLEDFDAITRDEIRNIFYDLEEGADLEDPDNPLAQLIVKFGYEIADFKDEIKKNVTAISDEINDYVEITEKDIVRIFSNYDPGEFEDPDAVFETTVIESLRTINEKLNSLELLHTTDLREVRAEMSSQNEILYNKVLVDLSKSETQLQQCKTELNNNLTNLQDKHNSDIEAINKTIEEHNKLLYDKVLVLLEELKNTIELNKISTNARFDSINDRVTVLEDYKTTLSANLDNLAKAIVRAFREYVSIDEIAIRDILSEFEENIMDVDIAKKTYEELSQFIKNEFIHIKSALEELDKRVSILEIRTDPYIAEESDIFALFPELDRSDIEPEFDIDNYPEATEEDIYGLFNKSAEEEQTPVTVESSLATEEDIYDMFGISPDEHQSVDVDGVLDNIATEEDILSMFDLDGQYSSLEELLEAIRNKQTEENEEEEATEEDIHNMFNPTP